MRVAITGGTGFVGRHLAERLDPEHTVIASRRTGISIDDVDALTEAFAGCDAIAHCAGINREIGDQTFERVHVDGTRAVIEAARRAGVTRILLLSFLRARPESGSPYHESKWVAEELVRSSGLEHTVLKAGMIYGPGDHLVDHVTRSVRTLPAFATVGLRERTVRPVPVADIVDVVLAALEGRISEPTVAVRGVDEAAIQHRRAAHRSRRGPPHHRDPRTRLGDPRRRSGHRVAHGHPAAGEGASPDARRGRQRSGAARNRPRTRRSTPPTVQRRPHSRGPSDRPIRGQRPPKPAAKNASSAAVICSRASTSEIVGSPSPDCTP